MQTTHGHKNERRSSVLLVTKVVVGLACGIASSSEAFAQDCNGNGHTDSCDISCTTPGCSQVPRCGTSSDCNSNGVPDECDPIAPFTSVLVTSSVTSPLFCTAPVGDSRLWIVQQDGRIRILSDGVVLPTPYLDISGLIATSGEQGLLGMAFDPNFSSNAKFYIYYTNTSGTLVIARYRATGNNPASNTASTAAVILKSIAHPTNTNHNGGCLQFGRDGFLYAGIGDGGGGNDPGNHAQDGNSLLGKMLRLDVNNPPTYVAAGNPFVGTAPRDEIWAFGYRNPWRFGIDRLTGDIFVGDVGQGAHEEIDFEPVGTGGRNYGWRCMEGIACTGNGGCTCNSASLTPPILDIPQTTGACSVIGGYVYRGCAIPGLQGTYFYSDLCGDYIKSFRYSPTIGITQHVDRTSQLMPDEGAIDTIVSFGQDGFGELYYCSFANGGGVYKIVPTSAICGNQVVEAGEECDDGNTNNGDGCDSNCNVESIGACCSASGGCSQVTSSACSASGGTYQGNGTDCSPNPCAQPTGACCSTSGGCSIVTSSACSASGGTYLGNGTDCSPNPCTQLTGACCAADDSCTVMTQSNCTAAGRTYLGDATACTASVCAQPTCADIRRLKAQCLSDGTLNVLVVLNNSQHSGQTVTVNVNGVATDLTIVGRLADANICCPSGTVTVSLTDPANCVPPVTVTCP